MTSRYLPLCACLLMPACEQIQDLMDKAAEDDGATPEAAAKAEPGADASAEAKAAKPADTAAPGEDSPKAPAADSAAKTGPAPAGDAPAAIPPGAPGPAYFVIDKKGVVILDDGKFELIPDSPKTLVQHFTRTTDGRLFLLAYKEIVEVKGKTLETIAEADDMPSDFAVTKQGHVWTVDYDGIHFFDGAKWTDTPKATLGEDVKLLDGVGVDSAGQVWVASSNELHTKIGEAWKSIDTKAISKRQLFLDGIEASPNGTLYAWTGNEIIEIAAGSETAKKAEFGLKGFLQIDSLSFSSNGTAAFRTGLKEVGRHDGTLKKWSGKKKQFGADHVGAVTADDQGRVWVASRVGVAVLGPNDEVTEWPSGSVAEIAGDVESIAIVGAGPTLPETGPVKTGGITGKLLRDGSGLAGLNVELCPNPSMMFSKTPCADSPVKFNTTTDDMGAYKFENVPLGAYGLAIKAEDGWRLTMGSDLGTHMKEGQMYDVGSMTIDKKDK